MPKPRVRHLSWTSDHKADERRFMERSGKKMPTITTIKEYITFCGEQYSLFPFCPMLSSIHLNNYVIRLISLASIGE